MEMAMGDEAGDFQASKEAAAVAVTGASLCATPAAPAVEEEEEDDHARRESLWWEAAVAMLWREEADVLVERPAAEDWVGVDGGSRDVFASSRSLEDPHGSSIYFDAEVG